MLRTSLPRVPGLCFAFLLSALLALPAEAQPAPSGRAGEFLVLTDIHFDPFTKPGLAAKLNAAPLEDWEPILRRSGTAFAPLGQDSNFALLDSALDAAAQARRRYQFVLVIGDLLAHDFPEDAEKALGSTAAARAFATKTSRFVARAVQARFPATPVIPAIGNEDGDCGDYAVEPGGSYLRRMADSWRVFRRYPRAQKSFASGGSFSLPQPGAAKQRLVVLNSVFLSQDYADACRPKDADPGAAALDWLARELEAARRKGERVTLAMHIPPGFDGYASASEGQACTVAVPLWKPEHAARFEQIVGQHRGTITTALAGHLHTDGFRLVGSGSGGKPWLPVHIFPSISPIFYNNPGFTVARFDERAGQLRNYAVTFTQLNGSAPVRAWRKEYSFGQAYGFSRASAAALTRLARRIEPGKPPLARFQSNFQVQANQTIAPALWRSTLCAQTARTEAEFVACRCR